MPQRSESPHVTASRVTALYEEALERAEEEEYEEALALLEEARELQPDHMGLYVTAAQILAADVEDFTAAEHLLRQAERVKPGTPAIALARADLAFQQGRFEEAEQAFRQLGDTPDAGAAAAAGVAKCLVARARQQMDRSRYEPALQLLQESMGWEATAPAHLNQGICYHALGNAQESYNHLAIAIDLAPENPVAYFRMGNLMGDCGEFERAAAAFAQTLEVDPDFPDARHRLASVQAMLGQNDAAINVLRAGLERDPDCPECHQLLAVAYMSSGRRIDAVPHLERLTQAAPDDFVARYNLGSIYALAGQTAEALPHLEAARAIDPELFKEGWAQDEELAALRERPEFRALAA